MLQPRGQDGAKNICDIVRFMFVCKTLNDMATLLNQIRDSPDIKVVRFKDRIKNPSGGWRDAMINFCVTKPDCPHHICEVQIVHQKMALCRRKDGLGGHDEYAQERNAREILEHLGVDAAARSSRAEEEASFRADAERGKVAIRWILLTRLRLSTAFQAGKWVYRAKSRVVPTSSAALRPQRSESKLDPAAIAAATLTMPPLPQPPLPQRPRHCRSDPSAPAPVASEGRRTRVGL